MKKALLLLFVAFLGINLSLAQHHENDHEDSKHAQTHTTKHKKGEHSHSDGTSHANHDEHAEEGFNAGEMIMHHIGDAHDFHLIGDSHLPLPIIAYNQTKGELDVFMSSKLRGHGHGDNPTHKGYALEHEKLVHLAGDKFLNFSITKNVFTIFLASLLMMAIFIPVAKAYAKRGIAAPKGIQSFFEPIILFIRDEVGKPFLGEKTNKFLPYLLTLFFFIWIVNMLGLVPFFPGSANVTGNIGVTLVLAMFTFFITQFNGNKHYWAHIFKPDVPVFLYPIIVPVEILGMFTKPFALMVRLMANISAGHIIILALVSLVFIFGEAGKNVVGGFTGGVVATAFGLFMNFMELLVAGIQAFIFTVLSAVFIGMAVEDHHDDHH